MHIKKSLPNKYFTKISNSLFTMPSISSGAKVLYGYLATLYNGANIEDELLCRVLHLNQRTLTRYKKELKDVDLILTEQLAPRVYDLYIGHPHCKASEVKRIWQEDIGVEVNK